LNDLEVRDQSGLEDRKSEGGAFRDVSHQKLDDDEELVGLWTNEGKKRVFSSRALINREEEARRDGMAHSLQEPRSDMSRRSSSDSLLKLSVSLSVVELNGTNPPWKQERRGK